MVTVMWVADRPPGADGGEPFVDHVEDIDVGVQTSISRVIFIHHAIYPIEIGFVWVSQHQALCVTTQ